MTKSSLITSLALIFLLALVSVLSRLQPVTPSDVETYLEIFTPGQFVTPQQLRELLPNASCNSASWYSNYCYGQNDLFRVVFTMPGSVSAPSVSLVMLTPRPLGDLVELWGRPDSITLSTKKSRNINHYVVTWDDVGGAYATAIVRSYGWINYKSLLFSVAVVSFTEGYPR